MRISIQILLFSSLIGTTFGASCGSSGIPFRFEVLPSGKPVLGCASPTCFGAATGGHDLRHDFNFVSGAEGEDGFFREGDLSRPRVRNPDAPSQQARCPSEIASTSCINPMTWVGGFVVVNESGDLSLQCCHYEGLKYSQEVGRPIVHPGEVYSGGEVLRDGRQTGFDAISNVKKINTRDGSVAYELTVTRMNCLPNPIEITNEVSFDIHHDISHILEKVGETQASGVQNNEIGDVDQRLHPVADEAQADTYAQPQSDVEGPVEQFVQVGEQVVPVTSAGYYYPVASGVPACFTSNSIVTTPEGKKRMEDLEIGDMVLTSEYGKMTFTRVSSWLHRLPATKAAFIRLEVEGEQTISLTPQHFIYKADCRTQKTDLTYAEDVKINDCLLIKNGESLKLSKVIKKSAFYSIGVYAPMTDTGDLIVDDIYASCHNVVKASTLSHTFLNMASTLQHKLRQVIGFFDDNGHLPATSEFFLNIVDFIVPHK